MTEAERLTNKYKSLLTKNDMMTKLRLSHTWGQAKVESDLKPKQENLNYSVEGLMKTFGRHRISEEDCKKYGRTATRKADQKAIANLIYGGEWGKKNLGNTQVGDGSRYVGKGILQITGRANYQKLTNDTGIDFINNPDLLLDEANSIIGMIWFINVNGLKKYMDKDDVLSVSKIINLGSINSKGTPKHLKERTEATNYYKTIFK